MQSAGAATCACLLPAALWSEQDNFSSAMQRLEAESGGRLGVCFFDGHGGEIRGYRQTERFPMCSTFKVLATAALLHRVDQGEEKLMRVVRFAQQDIVPYSPITKHHAGSDGMTLVELCQAAVTVSDNTAANLILKTYGGPGGFTAYARSLHDKVTVLNRMEPALNDAVPGDTRDTTSPEAMLRDLRALILGEALQAKSRRLLTRWMENCQTGSERIRAGLPTTWRVADKTGSGARNTTNDIAVFWDGNGKAYVLTVYLTGATLNDAGRNALLARVATAAAGILRA